MIARLAVAGLALIITTFASADWGAPCNATWAIDELNQRLTTIARCTFYGYGTTTPDTSVQVTGTMAVSPGSGGGLCQGWGYCGMSAVVSPYNASTTYTTNATFTASQAGVDFSSRRVTASITTPAPQRPRTNPEDPGDPEGGCEQDCTPIVINLSDGPWTLAGADDPVSFDIDADGDADRITWTGTAVGVPRT